MAKAATKEASKTAAKSEEKKSNNGRGKKIETPAKIVFGVDDKRAQYARLAVYNYGVKEKLFKASDGDVNSIAKSHLEKAATAITSGNLLHGPDGLDLISSLTKAGATDGNVSKNGLTKAYAAEVRPFIRKKQLSDFFGNRRKKAEPKPEKEDKKAKEEAAPPEAEAAEE